MLRCEICNDRYIDHTCKACGTTTCSNCYNKDDDMCMNCIDDLNNYLDNQHACEVPTVIMMVGAKGAGKNLAATYIKEMLEAKHYKVRETSLAEPLKKACSEVFRINRSFMDNLFTKELLFSDLGFADKAITAREVMQLLHMFGLTAATYTPYKVKSIRSLLQTVGTEILRKKGGPDIFCKRLHIEPDYINIITDVRFENEFNYFSNRYEVLPVYIKRASAEAKLDDHPTEQQFKMFRDKCVEIDNVYEDKSYLELACATMLESRGLI